MTRALLRFSSFAVVLLWAIAVHAHTTREEISFIGSAMGRGTFGLESHLDGEEVLRKTRWLELMSWNYIGHDPKQFRHYGPMARDFLAVFGNETVDSGDRVGLLMSAVEALKKRTTDLMKVGENAALKVRIESPGRLALSIQLLWD